MAVVLSPGLMRGMARLHLATIFRESGIDSADLDARLLVCAACGIDHSGLIRDPDLLLGAATEPLAAMAERRRSGEPISRILGRREFWGLPLAISPAVLDPRPETEGLVGALIDALGGQKQRPYRILDLGTGSGAILCALLSELPLAFGVGLDRSIAACHVARANLAATGFGRRAAILCGSWSDAIGVRFDIVVSNPPYIPHGAVASLARDVRDHDPVDALDGGTDGLDPYRMIVPRLAGLLDQGGIVGFECGFDQGSRIAAMLGDERFIDTMVYLDLAGHDRVVLASSRAG